MVMFNRRKSIVEPMALDDDQEVRQRNRLSKPLTNRTLTTVSTSSLQENSPQSNDSSTSCLSPGGPLSSHPTDTALRRQLHIQLFETDKILPVHALKHNGSTWSVSYTVEQFDRKSPDSPAPEPVEPAVVEPSRKPRKRKSMIFRSLSANRSAASLDRKGSSRINSLKSVDTSSSTSKSSADRSTTSPCIPTSRRASFVPGTATRKPTQTNQEIEVQEEQASVEQADDELPIVDSDDFEWQPPRPVMVDRAGTPSSLNYSHLSGLRHGSLQVTNGRASPAYSEITKMSNLLLTPQQDNTESSNYGDGEGGDASDEEATLAEDAIMQITPASSKQQENDGEGAEGGETLTGVRRENQYSIIEDTLAHDADQTSVMAKSYMDELPASPFSLRESSSLPRPIGSAGNSNDCDISVRRFPSLRPLRLRHIRQTIVQISPSPVSPFEQSPSSTGSVVHIRDANSCAETSLGFEQVGQAKLPPSTSVTSFYTSMEQSDVRNEVFQSAVEFQRYASSIQPPPMTLAEQSDSGYSSVESLRSTRMDSTVANTDVQVEENFSVATEVAPLPQIPSSLSNLRQRPSIFKRKTSPDLPTPAKLPPTVTAPSVLTPPQASVEQTAKSNRMRKRLQKKRPQSQPPGAPAVTRVSSVEFDLIPAIPPNVQENLRVRAQNMPELEQTYGLRHMQSSELSTSNLNLVDIRFPSPGPQLETQMRRSRSRSRPRSWISRNKTDAARSSHEADLSQAEALAIINRFGNEAPALGLSPYEHAREDVLSDKKTRDLRTRSMMDDKTAASYARLRSRSIVGRDNAAHSRLSFNDRGGLPGKNLRPASFAGDVPPITQEMLMTVRRTSLVQRHSMIADNTFPASAPPPPPLSPQPSYVACEEAESREAVLTSKPAYTPHPIDVTTNIWAAQAAVWKARRMSAGAALKDRHRQSERLSEEPAADDEPAGFTMSRLDIPEELGWPQCTSPEDYQPRQNNTPMPLEQHQNRFQPTDTRGERSQPPVRRRPLPPPDTSSRSPRPQSRPGSSPISAADLHHPLSPDMRYSQPRFDRYSGGFGWEYDRDNGFGGSAGTRTGSGQANATRRGVPLRASYGIDLGDVPVGIRV